MLVGDEAGEQHDELGHIDSVTTAPERPSATEGSSGGAVRLRHCAQAEAMLANQERQGMRNILQKRKFRYGAQALCLAQPNGYQCEM